jgi:hypothetical protein
MGNEQPSHMEQLVMVTAAMEEAGLDRLKECSIVDLPYLVRALYMAMEYERLGSDTKLTSIINHDSEIANS